MLRPLTATQPTDLTATAEPIVLCAADDNYVKPLAVTLHSAASNLRVGSRLKVIVLDGGISESNWNGLRETFADLPIDVFAIRPDLQTVKQLATSHHITHTAYFRLFAGSLLPSNIDKVIYLDSDLLVQDDLCELWDLPLDDNYALAVPDIACPFVDARHAACNFAKSSPYFAAISPVANWAELGLDPAANYFNSGVMVMNIDRMRRESIGERLLQCLIDNKKYVWCWDQYALNVVFAGHWKPLPLKWNQGAHAYEFPSAAHSPFNDEEFSQARDQPSIIHYTTEWKPWDYQNKHPLRERFFEQLDQTAWADWRPEQTPFSFAAKWQEFATEFVKQWVINYRKIHSFIQPPKHKQPASQLPRISTVTASSGTNNGLVHSNLTATTSPRLEELVTFFATPKAFTGQTAIAQENAIASWRQMANVILLGDDPGIAKAAQSHDVVHIPTVEKNENGTPVLSSVFAAARAAAETPYLVYCNCDIILLEDFAEAIVELAGMSELQQFVATASRTTVTVDGRVQFDCIQSRQKLRQHAAAAGVLDSIVCKDIFVFPRELYQNIPDFAVGRGNWDNWMIHHAKQNQIPVISLTDRVLTLHQQHCHVHAGNRYSAYVSGAEAKHNQHLAGGRHLISGSTPDYYLANQSLRPARMQYINGEFWLDFPKFVQLLANFVSSR